ncbi:MAG: hypothetical protein ACRDF0_10765, partial [Candidatus Limnocylindria bacterium]
GELNAAGAAPLPFLLAIAALVALLADGVVAANLYSGREWEEPDEELVRDQRPRRRASAR